MTTKILRPNGMGTKLGILVSLDPYPDTGEEIWEDVDDVASDEDATFVYRALSAAYNIFTFPTHSEGSGIINSVTIHYRVRSRFASGNYIGYAEAVLKTHNTEYCDAKDINGEPYLGGGAGLDWDTPTPIESISYVDWNRKYITNPNTGEVWTWDEVDALEAGVWLSIKYVDGGFARCTQLWIEVDYTPSPIPIVATNPATNLTENRATLNLTLDNDGGEDCDCWFEWGLTDSYGNTTPIQSGKTTGDVISQIISGLEAGTLYHFRAAAENSAGTGYGDDRTFVTESPALKEYSLAQPELLLLLRR